MAVRIVTKGKSINKESLKKLEEKMENLLADDFKSFLIQNNGGKPEDNEFTISKLGIESGVNRFLSVDEILAEKEILGERLLPEAWPIAEAEGGNLVCIIYKNNPGVYFWDHEYENVKSKRFDFENMCLLNDNFTGFYNNLKKFDPSKITIKPGQVKKVWIDPDFKPEF